MSAYPNECCARASLCICQVQTLTPLEVKHVLSAGSPKFVTQDSRKRCDMTWPLMFAAIIALTILGMIFGPRPAKAGVMWTPLGWRATPIWMEEGLPPPPPPMAVVQAVPPPAVIAPGARLVVHNGSLMAAESPARGTVTIRYVEPRPGLAAIGVGPGTQLVEGRWFGPSFRGTAVVFHPCGLVPYAVQGRVERGGDLVLRGPEAIVDPSTCIQIDEAWTSNSVLRFTPARRPQ